MVRLWHLSRRAPAYRRWGLEIVAFFESSPTQTRRYLDRLRPPFPLVADLGRRAYTRYGLEASWLGTVRGTLRRSVYREPRRRGLGDWRLLPGLQALEGAKCRLPADFLIGPDQRIRTAHYGATRATSCALPRSTSLPGPGGSALRGDLTRQHLRWLHHARD